MSSPSNRVLLRTVWGAVALVVTLAPARWSTGAETRPAASYVGSAECRACHPHVAEAWASSAHATPLADPQLPEERRACEACHGPGSRHVQSAGKQPLQNPARLKAAEGTALCGACHLEAGGFAGAATLEARAWKSSPHAAGEKGCLACHTLHGKGEHALSAPPAQLCTKCHGKLTRAPAGGAVHAPVKAGQCLLCHDPHGSKAPHSVKPNVSATCESCHSPGTDKMKVAHKGYQVAGADCTRCHDPHSFAADKALLRTVSHPPFASRNCQICHVGPPSTELKKPLTDTCYSCHPKPSVLPPTDDKGQPMQAHPPVEAGLCTQCHEPHASDQKGTLLRGDPVEVCLRCHKSVGTARGASHQHPPVAKGECLKCHAGHTSVQPALLHKEESALCQDCHKDQAVHAHPTGPNVKDPRTKRAVTCASCHAVHGSDFAYILPQQETALCLSCHELPKDEQ